MNKLPDNPGKKGKNIVQDRSPEDHGPEIDSELQAHIGRHLKASYDDILGQEVPDRFLDLLQQLESREKDASAPKGGRR